MQVGTAAARPCALCGQHASAQVEVRPKTHARPTPRRQAMHCIPMEGRSERLLSTLMKWEARGTGRAAPSKVPVLPLSSSARQARVLISRNSAGMGGWVVEGEVRLARVQTQARLNSTCAHSVLTSQLRTLAGHSAVSTTARTLNIR